MICCVHATMSCNAMLFRLMCRVLIQESNKYDRNALVGLVYYTSASLILAKILIFKIITARVYELPILPHRSLILQCTKSEMLKMPFI